MPGKKITFLFIRSFIFSFMIAAIILLSSLNIIFAQEEETERDTITLKVTIKNPSAEIKKIPVRIPLPVEITPKDIVNKGILDIEYDDEASRYVAYKNEFILRPRQMQNLEIEVEDIWYIPKSRLDAFKKQTDLLVNQLQDTEYIESGQKLSKTIYENLNIIIISQDDDTLGTKEHIGVYRTNLKLIEQIKEDIEQLERQVTLANIKTPEIIPEPEAKPEPTKAVIWIIVFIMLFIATLGGVFFFTWHARTRSSEPVPEEESP